MSEKNQSLSGAVTYRRLLKYTLEWRSIFLLAVLGMVIFAASQAGFVSLMRPLVDDGFVDRDAEGIRLVILYILGVFVIRGVGTFLSTYCMAFVGRHIIKRLRKELFEQLLHIPTRVYDKLTSGSLISTLTYNVEQVAESTTNTVTILVRDSFTLLFLLGWMFYQEPILTLTFLISAPLIAVLVYVVNIRFRKVSKRIQESMGNVTHIVGEAIDGHGVVKIFGGEAAESASFEAVNEYNRKQHMKLVLVKATSMPIVQVIAGLSFAGIVFMATSDYLMKPLSPGTFMTFIGSILLLFQPLRQLTQISDVIQRGIAAAESIFTLLDSDQERDTGEVSIAKATGNIEYKNVSFTYSEGEENILKNISFNVKAGETVAFVGRSGSGKTTLMNLLPRFYDIEHGEVLLDGHAIHDYQLAELRGQMSYVGQNVTLFNDTIANNIAYGALAGADRDDIIRAAKAANAWDFIQAMPEGLDTEIGEDGVLLSGGQRQRLAIARALLKDAPILILDEATSALDSESERHIQAALEKLVQNRTTFVIAHRLSTVEKADKIIVMESGEIIESGSHAELLKKDGQYASLYKLQFNTDLLEDEKPSGQQKLEVIEDYSLPRRNFLVEDNVATIWERMWYGHHPLMHLLAPFSYFFRALVWLRKLFYKLNVFASSKATVPVIVIGNITVGGTGKTPLVIWMVKLLQRNGYKPGVISRGYRGKSTHWPLLVTAETDTELCGDEAGLIAQQAQCPVVVGPKRNQSINFLAEKTDCDIIVSDDGLQHYAMRRDIEVIVADGSRGFGNCLLLPAGPMREPKSRLKKANFIVTNGASLPDSYSMYVKGDKLYDLGNAEHSKTLDDFAGTKVHAVAAIGNPERFFELLRRHGIHVVEHVLPDHHDYVSGDLVFEDRLPVLMTEKDAMKCRKFAKQFDEGALWYLPVHAQLSSEFGDSVINRLDELKHG